MYSKIPEKEGKVGQYLQLFDQMGLSPDLHTLGLVLNMYTKQLNEKKVHKILIFMKKKNVPLDLFIYNLLISMNAKLCYSLPDGVLPFPGVIPQRPWLLTAIVTKLCTIPAQLLYDMISVYEFW